MSEGTLLETKMLMQGSRNVAVTQKRLTGNVVSV
jgi:hypothetical protein